MSGLAGFVSLDGEPASQERLDRMVAAAAYFRPDDIGSWRNGPAAFLHAKLATTPEAVAEKQPLTRGNITLCFDGRLDNREELLREFQSKAAIDAQSPDSELVLAAYNGRGDDLLQLLVGDYSLVLWIHSEQKLLCARSVLGYRPFLWHCSGKQFTFASQPKVLMASGDIPRRINEPIIAEILALRFTSPAETMWQGVYRLPPGSALVVHRGQPRLWRWYGDQFPEFDGAPEKVCIDRFLKLFDQSLGACLRSSGPVAAHLSGGLDSSSITCRAVELYRAGRVPRLVQPVSAVFPGETHDESVYSQAAEAHINVATQPVHSRPYDWDAARAWSAQTLHLPLRPNTAGVVIAVCEKLQADGTRVLLTGEGGDDWLSGSQAHWSDLLRQGRLVQLACEGLADQPERPRWRALFATARRSVGPWISARKRAALLWPHLRLDEAIPDWISPEWARRVGLQDRSLQIERGSRLPTFSQQQRSARYYMARTYINQENVLAFAGTRHIELRHPLHDRRLTEYLMSLPGELFRHAGQKKHLLREAMKGILPEVIRTRQTKARFFSPILAALDLVRSETDVRELICVREGWLDGKKIWQQIEAARATKPGEISPSSGNIGPAWLAMSMETWLRHAEGL